MMLKIYLHALFFTLSVGLFSLEDFLTEISSSVTSQAYLFVGDDLILNCTLNDDFLKNFSAHNITFKFQFKPSSDAKCVPLSSIKVVDTNLATLVIHNVTPENAGTYACYVGSTNCTDEGENSDTELVGLSDDVIVEYPPQDVNNFLCVVYNWDEFMTCTWQHPVTYSDWSNIQVTIDYAIPKRQQVKAYSCPDPEKNSCTWNQGNFSSADTYFVEVNVTNIKNNATATRIFEVNTSDVVKPAPVANLTIETSEDSPGCFNLSWTHSRPHHTKVCRVKHRNESDKKFEVLNDNLASTNFIACGYLPYTYHYFSVDCYPTYLYSGYWSDPVNVSARTLMTAPCVGPRTTNGSFTTTDCAGGLRSVTVMWQEVEVSARNGIIDGYLIRDGERILRNVSADMHAATVELPCDSASDLTIFAHNKGGYSLRPSVLVIPPVTFSVPQELQETFSVDVLTSQNSSKQNDSLRALWEVHEKTANVNYTIFWCKGLPGKSCTGQINWSSAIPGTQSEYNIPVPSSDDAEYIFGITVTDTETRMTSGIFWTGCLFIHSPTILHKKTVDSPKVEPGVNKVQVSWAQIQCNYQSRIKVTAYKVKWCEVTRCNNTDGVTSVIVPAKAHMYTVSTLTAKVNYSFTVQPVSFEDDGVEVTPWMSAVPDAPENQTWMVLVIVVICVALTVIAVAAVYIYCRCQKCRNKIKRLVPKDLLRQENTAPEVPGTRRFLMSQSDPSRNAAVRLMSVTSMTSDSSTEPVHDNGPASPQRATTNQNFIELSDGHQNRRTGQESVPLSSSESIQPYQQFAVSPSNQSSEHHESYQQDDRVGQESVPLSSSESIQPYQQFAVSPSNQSSEHHESYQQDDRVGQESVPLSSSESIQPYQQFAVSPSNQSSEHHESYQQDDRVGQESVPLSSSESVQSYQQFAYSPSNQSSEVQTGSSFILDLGDIHLSNTATSSPSQAVSHLRHQRGLTKESDTEQHQKTKETSFSTNFSPISTMAPDVSTRQGHIAVALDPGLRSSAEINRPNDNPSGGYLSHTSQAVWSSAGTASSQYGTDNSQTPSDTSYLSQDYIHMKTFRQLSTDSDSSS